MKKVFRLIIISALLLGIFIPVVDHFYQEKDKVSLTMAQDSRDRNISELLKLAKEAYYEGNYQSAENHYLEIIELDPFNLESRRNLAVIYNDQNKLQAENRTLLQLAILSNQSQDYLDLAVNFYEINNNLASIFILENKINLDIDQKSLLFQKYYYLIKNNLDLKKLEKAEEYLMKITNLKINQSEIYLLSAELNRYQNNFKQAFENYQAAYQANRSQTYLFKNMAEMLELAGEEIEAYNYWQRTLSYGWFRDLAYQKINQYQNKYPQLKPDEDKKDKPEEINPFALEASWREVEEINNQKKTQMLRIGLQENNKHLLFQYSAPFSVVYDGKIIYRGQAKKNYLLEIDAGSLSIFTRE